MSGGMMTTIATRRKLWCRVISVIVWILLLGAPTTCAAVKGGTEERYRLVERKPIKGARYKQSHPTRQRLSDDSHHQHPHHNVYCRCERRHENLYPRRLNDESGGSRGREVSGYSSPKYNGSKLRLGRDGYYVVDGFKVLPARSAQCKLLRSTTATRNNSISKKGTENDAVYYFDHALNCFSTSINTSNNHDGTSKISRSRIPERSGSNTSSNELTLIPWNSIYSDSVPARKYQEKRERKNSNSAYKRGNRIETGKKDAQRRAATGVRRRLPSVRRRLPWGSRRSYYGRRSYGRRGYSSYGRRSYRRSRSSRRWGGRASRYSYGGKGRSYRSYRRGRSRVSFRSRSRGSYYGRSSRRSYRSIRRRSGGSSSRRRRRFSFGYGSIRSYRRSRLRYRNRIRRRYGRLFRFTRGRRRRPGSIFGSGDSSDPRSESEDNNNNNRSPTRRPTTEDSEEEPSPTEDSEEEPSPTEDSEEEPTAPTGDSEEEPTAPTGDSEEEPSPTGDSQEDTPEPTQSEDEEDTPEPTESEDEEDTPEPTESEDEEETPEPTPQPTPQPTDGTPRPTEEGATPQPTVSPTPQPTASPTPQPTEGTPQPTVPGATPQPTVSPTPQPTPGVVPDTLPPTPLPTPFPTPGAVPATPLPTPFPTPGVVVPGTPLPTPFPTPGVVVPGTPLPTPFPTPGVVVPATPLPTPFPTPGVVVPATPLPTPFPTPGVVVPGTPFPTPGVVVPGTPLPTPFPTPGIVVPGTPLPTPFPTPGAVVPGTPFPTPGVVVPGTPFPTQFPTPFGGGGGGGVGNPNEIDVSNVFRHVTYTMNGLQEGTYTEEDVAQAIEVTRNFFNDALINFYANNPDSNYVGFNANAPANGPLGRFEPDGVVTLWDNLTAVFDPSSTVFPTVDEVSNVLAEAANNPGPLFDALDQLPGTSPFSNVQFITFRVEGDELPQTASPFGLTYNLPNPTFTDAQRDEATQAIINYLDTYFAGLYAGVDNTEFVGGQGQIEVVPLPGSAVNGNEVFTNWDATTITFGVRSINTPDTPQVDAEFAGAFNDQAAVLLALQQLDPSNPFSQATSVIYTPSQVRRRRRRKKRKRRRRRELVSGIERQ